MSRILITTTSLILTVGSFPAWAESTYSCVTYNATQIPGSLAVYPTGINNAGAVVGTYATVNQIPSQFPYGGIISFLRQTDGAFTVLQYPEAVTTWAYTINNSGQIAGTYQDSSNNKHGFIRSATGSYSSIDLPAAPAGHTWNPQRFWVYGINDAGELSGITADPNPLPGQIWHFIRDVTGTFQYFDPVEFNPNLLNGYQEALSYPISAGPLNNSGMLLESFGFASDDTKQLRNADGSFTDVQYLPGADYPTPMLSGLSNTGLIAGSIGFYNVPAGFSGQYLGGGRPTVTCNPDSSTNAAVQAFAVNDAGVISGAFGSAYFALSGGFIATPTGKTSGLTLSNTDWQFANHPVGQTSGPGVVYLTSNGTADLNIQSISINLGAGDPNDFKIVSTTCLTSGSFFLLPKTIPTGQTCQIVFDFKPSLAGNRNAQILITDDTPQAPHVIPIRGTGLGSGLVLSNASWNFSPNETTPQSGTVYAYNPGTEPTTISAIEIQNSPVHQLSFTTTCGTNLAPYATCGVTFTLVPGVPPGTVNARLAFLDNAANSTQQSVSITNQ